MTEEQEIVYAPQWGNMTVDNVTFQTNNVIRNFNYVSNIPAYHPIMKFLMNCPLKLAFTKIPSVLYQNLLIEFWSNTVAYDHNPPTDDSMDRPLREFLIKFSVMNDQPFTLDFNTFHSSTGFDYNKQKYVAYPTPETFKTTLRKIATNASYLDKNPVLKKSFLVAWRILFIFVIQVDIEEIIYIDLVTKLLSHEASESLPQKRKKPKSKKPPTKTKEAPPPSQQRVLSNPTQSPRAPYWIPKIQRETYNSLGLPSMTSNEGTTKTTPRLEGPLGNKDLKGNKPPADMKPINPTVTNPLGTGAEYQVDKTQSTRLRYQTLTENKGKTSSKVELDHETLQLTTVADMQAYLLSKDKLAQENYEEEVFVIGDDMEKENQVDDEEHLSHP
uniref:Uncharacterized protein n=1 Tax=Tanacetum cinerariifolium TaxID=118510 RepID=A0A6L2KD88_TANCI|nr:hypothetical protein [Tanacetum cinerariifolium]